MNNSEPTLNKAGPYSSIRTILEYGERLWGANATVRDLTKERCA